MPRLVRGLDYYVRTAFEIVGSGLGSQNALAGGGRYDGLSEILGGPPAKGFGFAMGLDRLVMVLPQQISEGAAKKPEIFLVHLSEPSLKRSITIARHLRRKGLSCRLEFDGKSPRSQMRLANKIGARHVLIIGDEELARERYAIKRMEDSTQWDVSLQELTEYLQSLSA